MEVIKICSGRTDDVLNRRMVCYDGLNSSNPWRTVTLSEKKPGCPVCSTDLTLSDLKTQDYTTFCPRWKSRTELPRSMSINSDQFISAWKASSKEDGEPLILLDVRPDPHFQVSRIPRAINWPLEVLKSELKATEGDDLKLAALILQKIKTDIFAEINAGKTVVSICRRGNDSAIATSLLSKRFDSISNDLRNRPLWSFLNLDGGLTNLREVASLVNVPLV